jgi:tight adherence protein B
MSLKEALDGSRCSSPHLELAFVVLRACALHGGPASEPIDRAAATLRARDADDADRRTQSAQARLSAVVMTILPGAMLATMLVTSDATRLIMRSPIGLIIVVIGGGLNVIGWHWMRRMIDGDTT